MRNSYDFATGFLVVFFALDEPFFLHFMASMCGLSNIITTKAKTLKQIISLLVTY
jgi:hypothetical protein